MTAVGERTDLHALVVIDSLTAGGAEMLLADFAAGAAEVGMRVSVAYLGERDGTPAAARLREQGVEPVPLDLRGLVDPASFLRVRRHIAALRPDVVHTHLAYADAVGGFAARSLGRPCVSTIHVMDWSADGARERARRRLIALARRRCAAAVVAVSDASRTALLETGLERPERVVTIRNGIAARPQPGAGVRLRAELGIAPDELVVVQVAVLRPRKGHAAAAEAVQRLRAGGRRVRLLVVGDGPARGEVEELLAPLGKGALALGHRDDVMAVLDSADVLAHPSEIDAFPTVLLEAMASGLPVVATAVGGIPEIVVPGETGLLVDAPARPEQLADALARVLDDGDLRTAYGAAGRARFERELTAASWARRTRDLYERVLAGDAPVGPGTPP